MNINESESSQSKLNNMDQVTHSNTDISQYPAQTISVT